MKNLSKQWTFLIIVTAVNVLVATGYSIAGILAPHTMLSSDIVANQASSIFALYAGARTIPLTIIALISIIKQNKVAIITLALLAGCIQFSDGFIGIYQQDILKSAGPFFIAIVQFVSVLLVLESDR
jgi:hypothetical protein